MKTATSTVPMKRRHFITQSFASCTALCLGCSLLSSTSNAKSTNSDKAFQDKYAENSDMSYEQVFNFAYRNIHIPQFIEISNQVGREKFVDMLKNASDKVGSRAGIIDSFHANLPDKFMNNVIDVEFIENTPELQEYKVKKCLWANTFRDCEAADIGYAMICYVDYAYYRLNNIKLIRETTLMQGDDFCHYKQSPVG